MAVSHVNAFKPDSHSFSSSNFDNHITHSQRCDGGRRAEGAEGVGPETADMNGLITQLKEVVAQLKDIIAQLKGGAGAENKGAHTPTDAVENQQPESPQPERPVQKSEGGCGVGPTEGAAQGDTVTQLQDLVSQLSDILAKLKNDGSDIPSPQNRPQESPNQQPQPQRRAEGQSNPQPSAQTSSSQPGERAGENQGVTQQLQSIIELLKQIIAQLGGGQAGAQSQGAPAGKGDAAGSESLPELTNELDSLINKMPGQEGAENPSTEPGGVMEELKSVVEELKQVVQTLGGEGAGADHPQQAPVQEARTTPEEPVSEPQTPQNQGAEDPAVQEWLDFKADRQQRMEQTDDPALKKHYQAEIDVANATLSQMGVSPEAGAPESASLPGGEADPSTTEAVAGGTPVKGDPSAYDDLIQQAAEKHGVDPGLIRAVIAQESGFDPTAVSPSGCVGLMQVRPSTAESMGGGDLYDPATNIDLGTQYLKQMLDLAGGDTRKALVMYNAGPNAGSADVIPSGQDHSAGEYAHLVQARASAQ